MKTDPIVLNNKYIIQHPYTNNCLLVALANLFIHDNTMTTNEGLNLVAELTDKFNANEKGIQPLLIGETLYKMKYDQCLIMSPGDLKIFDRLQREGWLGIRAFTIYTDNSKKLYPHFISQKERQEYNEWVSSFNLFFSDNGEKKSVYGAHAVFFYNFVYDGVESTVDVVNLTNKINNCKWLDMGVPGEREHMMNIRALGSQLCIMARKRQ
jgi:hypothetical protein